MLQILQTGSSTSYVNNYTVLVKTISHIYSEYLCILVCYNLLKKRGGGGGRDPLIGISWLFRKQMRSIVLANSVAWIRFKGEASYADGIGNALWVQVIVAEIGRPVDVTLANLRAGTR